MKILEKYLKRLFYPPRGGGYFKKSKNHFNIPVVFLVKNKKGKT